jgi:hypothetical protein
MKYAVSLMARSLYCPSGEYLDRLRQALNVVADQVNRGRNMRSAAHAESLEMIRFRHPSLPVRKRSLTEG